MAKIIVTVKESRHTEQPYTYDINKPGPAEKETKRTRYGRRDDAQRGARRSLGAQWNDEYGYWEAPAGSRGQWYEIVFKFIPKR